MDHITSLDLFLTNNQSLPAHINHTGFGMYWLLSMIQKWALNLNFLSAIKLDDLAQSLNPLLIIGENLHFVRSLTPLILIMTCLIISAAAINFQLEKSSVRQILIVLFFLTLPAITYHSAFVRTEVYSLFFWSFSFFAISKLSIKNSSQRNEWLILLAGLLMGLAFITKLQVVFYVCLIPLFIFLFYPDYPLLFNFNKRKNTFFSFLNLLLVLLYFYTSWKVVIPAGFADFTALYGLNIFGAAYLFFSIALFFFFLLESKIDWFGFISKELSIINYLILGFSVSFLCHFFIYDNLAASSLYLSYNFKVLFLRKNSYSQVASFDTLIQTAMDFLQLYWPLVLGAMSSICLFLISHKKNLHRFQLICLMAIVFILFFNSLLGVRFMLRDLLWFQPIFAISFYLFLRPLHRKNHYIAITVYLGFILFNLWGNQHMLERIYLNYNNYGFQKKKILKGVYGNSRYPYEQYIYQQIGRDKNNLVHSFEQAVRGEFILDWAQRIFYNRHLNLQNLGLLREGLKFHPQEKQARFLAVPAELKNSLVVNFSSSKLKEIPLPVRAIVDEHSETLNKFTHKTYSGSIIVPQKDTNVYVFFAEGEPEVKDCPVEKVNHNVRIGNPTKVQILPLYLVKNMCLLPKNINVYGVLSGNKI